MKKTDLEKNKALKIMGQMRQAGAPSRFAGGAATLIDRREQRRLDQAAGLVPFAVKLPQALVTQLRELADAEGVSLHELSARLLGAGLANAPADVPAEKAKPAVKAKPPAAAKKAVKA